MNEMKFSDSVWHRVVQIVQEAIITGVDCTDILRQVRVVCDSTDPHVLVLSPAYEQQVKDMHEQMLKQAREIQSAIHVGPRFIISGDSN